MQPHSQLMYGIPKQSMIDHFAYEEEHSQAVTVWTTQWNFQKIHRIFLRIGTKKTLVPC